MFKKKNKYFYKSDEKCSEKKHKLNSLRLLDCPKLKFVIYRCLDLNGNKFRNPRHQILAKGTDAIMSYLRDRISA